jgi:hypothetical protein
MIRHEDIRPLSGNVLETFHPHLHSIGPKGYLSPKPREAVIQPSAPVKRIADNAQRAQNGAPNGDAEPDKDCPNHKLKNLL